MYFRFLSRMDLNIVKILSSLSRIMSFSDRVDGSMNDLAPFASVSSIFNSNLQLQMRPVHYGTYIPDRRGLRLLHVWTLYHANQS